MDSGGSKSNGGELFRSYGEDASGLRKKQRYRKFGALAILGIVIAGGIIYLVLKSRKKEATEEETRVVSVRVAKAERSSISATATAIGTIWPREQATVSAKIGSQIKSMGIVKNKPVKAGDIVATLETRDLQAQRAEAASALDESRLALKGVVSGSIPQTSAQDEKALRDARANVENARAVFERRQRLFQQGGISQKDVEASQLALTTAENDLRLAESTEALHKSAINPNDRAVAESRVMQSQSHLASIETQLAYAEIRSPITGVITDQFQYQGEYASPGGKMFAVADMSRVIVKAPFADEIASQLNKGDPATVKPADSPDQELAGSVSLVSRSGDPTNRAVEVWVDLPNPSGSLRAMGSAQVSVQSHQTSDSVVVPSEAVLLDATTANAGYVMVVDDQSVAREVRITAGIRNKDKMQITSGLKGGETVVVQGNYALPDKAKVEINTAEPGKEDSEPDKDDSDKDEKDKSNAGDKN
jgi:multidrug efflux pump subunit AcrA (membrane-fusion protein)